MSLCIFLAEKYPAHKSLRLPGFLFDHAPTSIESGRKTIIQSRNMELNTHGPCPVAPPKTQVTPPLRKSVDIRRIIPSYFLGDTVGTLTSDARSLRKANRSRLPQSGHRASILLCDGDNHSGSN
jgi:hypothetical protein